MDKWNYNKTIRELSQKIINAEFWAKEKQKIIKFVTQVK